MSKEKKNFDYMQRLQKPEKKIDVVIDTDMFNEIDDLYALAYLISSNEQLNLKGIFAAPFYSPKDMGRTIKNNSPKEGMEQSYNAILELLEVMKREDLKEILFHGSASTLVDEKTPVISEAAEELVRLAREHTPEDPLYVIAIAVLTDIASAILMAPDILNKIVVVWLGGHGLEWQSCNDFNASQDIAAARVVFDTGVALVQIPCLGVVSEFHISRIELEHRLMAQNSLCEYLLDQTCKFMALKKQTPNWSKPLWDVTAVAWLVRQDFMEDRYEHSPLFGYDRRYSFDHTRHFIKYVYKINRDILFDDLFDKLTK